ncbi:unnamed protein product, partial [Pocillopora meandrina]
MENEAYGLTDSFVARHTTDPTLRLELLSRNQNGLSHDQRTGMGAEIADSSAAGSPSAEVFPTNSQAFTLFPFPPLNIRPWNVESLESTNNSPLALVQGVARATVQMNRGMREREQRELEREQLQTDQDRRETQIRMRRKREMIERERREIRRSRGRREWQEAVPGPWCSCRLDEVINIFCFFPYVISAIFKVFDFVIQKRTKVFCWHQSGQIATLWVNFKRGTLQVIERNSVFTNAVENFDQRSGQSGGSVTNRSHSSFVLDELGQRVDEACTLLERVSRERQGFDREIERQEHEIRTGAVLSERTLKKRGGEARQLPEDNLLHHDISKCNVCLNKWLQGKPKCIPQSGQDECCICLEDALSGYQILPCSHKVHRECAIAIIQNGVRCCPICHHPLFG